MYKSYLFVLLLLLGVGAHAQDTIINTYASVLRIDTTNCIPNLTVDTASGFSANDDVLLIQMKGAVIDSTNDSTFGTMLNWHNVGNYEFNKIESVSGTSISLKYRMSRQYDCPSGIVQLVKVPHFTSYTINRQHTCRHWDTTKGGIFAIIVDDSLVLDNNISVLGKGFKAGHVDTVNSHSSYIAGQTDFCYPANQINGASKGEGITNISNSKRYCRGPLYNGGGGGNSTNAGGGGGANAGVGGKGGNEWQWKPAGSMVSAPVGGWGGYGFVYSHADDKLFMAGGGGAGHENDNTLSDGGYGGGMVLIIANKVVGNNDSIIAEGAQGLDCNCIDGVGGGGGGGTVLINAQSATQLNISVKGGRGAYVYNNDVPHPPGGGGGGGVLLINSSSLLSGITYNDSGAHSGHYINTWDGIDTVWGATDGKNGAMVSDFTATIDTVISLFDPAIIITDTFLDCKQVRLKATVGSGGPVSGYTWFFGDGSTMSGNPVTHIYAGYGTYNVKLVVTNAKGCTDTDNYSLVVPAPNLHYTIGDSQINCKTARLFASYIHGDTAKDFNWYFPDTTSSTGDTATHIFRKNGTYTVKLVLTNAKGCTDTMSYTFKLTVDMNYTISDSVINCKKAKLDAVYTSGDTAVLSRWYFDDGASAATMPVIHRFPTTGVHNVGLLLTNSLGCTDSMTYAADLAYSLPITVSNDTAICKNAQAQLNAWGANTYVWSPADKVSEATIANPLAKPDVTTWFVVTGTDTIGCVGKDSVLVSILPGPYMSVSSDGMDITCTNTSVRLFASGAIKYLWRPAMYCDDSTSNSPLVSPDTTTVFYVTGTDIHGCTSVDTISVKSDKDVMVFVPSAFTPNGDGLNDKIYPIVFCDFIFERFNVYDRWGERVFTTAVYKDGWDGKFNNQPMEMGTYFYYVRGRKITGEHVIIKGDFTLIR